MKKIHLAEHAGFCYGVHRAVQLAEAAAPCATLGPLIHNRFAVAELATKGVRVADSIDDLHPGETAVIRSHGAPPSVYETLRARNINFVDATCPYVSKVHHLAKQAADAGKTVVIFGDAQHPEVKATVGVVPTAKVISTTEELDKNPILCNSSVFLLAQTTASPKNFKKIQNFLEKTCTNLEFSDTICRATLARQKEAAELSLICDAMVVVGDRQSANTKNLADVCICPVFLTERELPDLTHFHIVGLTAGASTPATIIQEVFAGMNSQIESSAQVSQTSLPQQEVHFR